MTCHYFAKLRIWADKYMKGIEMNKFKIVSLAMAGVLGALSAAPALACTSVQYTEIPEVHYTGPVYASANTTLYADSTIDSPNGVYHLKFQKDGNLVLLSGTTVIWDAGVTNCYGSGYITFRTRFQPDGNLVVYYSNNVPANETPAWSTGTAGHTGARLAVQNDGNLVIYDAANRVLWKR
jgi:hypothetical protein